MRLTAIAVTVQTIATSAAFAKEKAAPLTP